MGYLLQRLLEDFLLQISTVVHGISVPNCTRKDCLLYVPDIQLSPSFGRQLPKSRFFGGSFAGVARRAVSLRKWALLSRKVLNCRPYNNTVCPGATLWTSATSGDYGRCIVMSNPAKSAVSAVSAIKRQSAAMPPQFNGPSNGDSRRPQTYTITGLKRWSVVNKEIPGRFACVLYSGSMS